MKDTRARVAFYPDAQTAVVYHEGLVLTCMDSDQLWRALSLLSTPHGIDSLRAQLEREATGDTASNVADSELIAEWLANNKPTIPERKRRAEAREALAALDLFDLEI